MPPSFACSTCSTPSHSRGAEQLRPLDPLNRLTTRKRTAPSLKARHRLIHTHELHTGAHQASTPSDSERDAIQSRAKALCR